MFWFRFQRNIETSSEMLPVCLENRAVVSISIDVSISLLADLGITKIYRCNHEEANICLPLPCLVAERSRAGCAMTRTT